MNQPAVVSILSLISNAINPFLLYSGSKEVVLTGDRPTGPLHLGHFVGSLQKRLQLQDSHPLLILIADTQVLNNDLSKSSSTLQNTLHLMRDYLRAGLSPQKCLFVRQSSIPQIFELANYLSNLTTLAQVMRNPTIKSESQMYNNSLNMGFLNYPISQTADILLFNSSLVPVGQDQVPILEFANDLAIKFNYHFKTNIFNPITPVLSTTAKLVGIDGKNKMSKSLNNSINLSDSMSEVKMKINKMYTDSNHLRLSDPGQVQGNTVFDFLDVFLEDKNQLQELKEHYTRGGLGDRYLKDLLYKQIEKILIPMQEKNYSDDYLLNVLNENSTQALKIAQHNIEIIKSFIFK